VWATGLLIGTGAVTPTFATRNLNNAKKKKKAAGRNDWGGKKREIKLNAEN
jgi:hypothetical protein